MTAENPTPQELLHQRNELAKTLALRGGEKNWNQAVELYTTNILEYGLNTESLIGVGMPLRMLNRHGEAIQSFLLAAGLAMETNNQDDLLVAYVGLIDACRTIGRDKTFVYPEYIREDQQKKRYSLLQASVYMELGESLIAQMPAGNRLAKVEAFLNFGLLKTDMQDPTAALGYYAQAESMCRNLITNDATDHYLQNRLGRILSVKGVSLGKVEHLEEATAAEQESKEIYNQLAKSGGDATRDVSNIYLGLGNLSVQAGKIEEARKYYEEGLAIVTGLDGQPFDGAHSKLYQEKLAQLPKTG